MEKQTKFYFAHYKYKSTREVVQTKKVNLFLNCGTSQPDSHFAGQNARCAVMSRTGPLYHPYTKPHL